MAITFEPILISTPEYPEPLDPTIICRWVATESEINFHLSRKDYLVVNSASNGGFLQITITPSPTAVVPVVNDEIAVYDETTDAMFVGTLTNVGAYPVLVTDIDWIPGMSIKYMNDNTLHGGYYFEGQLTINGIPDPLTVIASPDSFGFADLDVAGVLRIKTSLVKTGDYTNLIMKEPTKSGNFSLEYRGRWYVNTDADIDDYTPEGGIVSPPCPILWYYGECVRSEEQGTNLHEYVVNAVRDAPFLNLFDRPVFFSGLPFDLSFIMPEFAEVTPVYDFIVTMKIYNSVNTQLGADIVTYVDADDLEGFINSLNINPAVIPVTADHMTVQIEI
jgi:hypothetical protein